MGESGKHSVVIVEDEGLIAEDIRRQLIAAGYRVPGIADAAPAAMEVIRATAPDVVLMDIRIKGDEDGINVARTVRDRFDVPVVFLTAYEDAQTLERASETHPYGYIRKPVSGASLRGSIEIAIAKHRHDRQVRQQRDWAMNSFAAVPYAIVLTDERGRVTWLNALAEELSGATAEMAIGRPWGQVLPLFFGPTGRRVEDVVSLALLSGEVISLPAGVTLATGADERISLEGSIAPVDKAAPVAGAVIAFQDATRERFEEEHRLFAGKHGAMRRLVESIASRLPSLRLVDTDTVLAIDGNNQRHEPRTRVEQAQGALTDSFSMSSRLSALLQSPELHLERVVLNEILPQLETALRPNAPQLDIVVDSEPVFVHADKANLKNALVTFVQQARLRMKRGGRVVIDVSRPEIKDMRHWVRIRLSYSSAEPPRSALERAFEPLLQDTVHDPYLAYDAIRSMGGMLLARTGAGDTIAIEIYLRQLDAEGVGREFTDSVPVCELKS